MSLQLDVVIHNARTLDSLKLDQKGRLTRKQWEKELFMAVIFPDQLNNMLLEYQNPIQDVIFIGSMYGVVAPNPSLYKDFKRDSPMNYGVAKAAQIHMVKEMAVRYSDLGIRVNCVSYGGVEGRANSSFMARYAELSPSGRMLNEQDLYPPIKFILENIDIPLTGENIKVDGGWTLW